MPRQPLALVYNPVAGSRAGLRSPRTLDEVVAALKNAGGEPEILPSRGPGDGFQRGDEAARRHKTVAVLGGDGTLNEVLNGVISAKTGSRVLLLPGGTVNVLARDLAIPLDPVRAAALLATGLDRRLFLGRVGGAVSNGPYAGGRYFAMMASAGVDASIVHSLSATRRKRTLGVFAYVLEGLRQTFTYRFPRLRVLASGEQVEGYLAVVGKSPGYGGWFSVTPGADPGDPTFHVAVCTSRNPLKYYSSLALALAGRLEGSRSFVYLRALRVELTAETHLPLQVDGEAYGSLPVTIESDGVSVQILTPAPPRR